MPPFAATQSVLILTPKPHPTGASDQEHQHRASLSPASFSQQSIYISGKWDWAFEQQWGVSYGSVAEVSGAMTLTYVLVP